MMEYREAISQLIRMIEKYPLEEKEREALMTAIGMLDAGALGKNRMKGIIKKKKEQQNNL